MYEFHNHVNDEPINVNIIDACYIIVQQIAITNLSNRELLLCTVTINYSDPRFQSNRKILQFNRCEINRILN